MKNFVNKLGSANDKIDKVFDWIMVLLLAAVVIALTAQVIWRRVFDSPIVWTEELARFLFVWSTFIGASWMAKRNMHIEMISVFKMFPSRVQQIVQACVILFIIAILVVIFPASCTKMMQQNTIASNTLGGTMIILYACAPVGIVLMVIQYFVNLLSVVFDWEGYKEKYYKKED